MTRTGTSTSVPKTIQQVPDNRQEESVQKRIENAVMSSRPKCDDCGGLFRNIPSLTRHITKNVCSLECGVCKTVFTNAGERRRHQRTAHPKPTQDEPVHEPEIPPALSKNGRSQDLTQARNLLSNGSLNVDETPRKEVENSDADDMLSPPEVARTKRNQSRKFTRSSSKRAEMRMNDVQE
ncbi:hypothetical protein EYC84_009569 [Monilinia fructicola]|uniref:C2H2-type domain-containing protein n=1 Tax=Monilinia fructicola TaxID=38448 RepID=A0A5M9JAW5_MONFR|nr:hypothetical protein EYC84_009569 [Monilinia fructicola]